MPMPRMRPLALSIALLALSTQASADSEQLEAGLRAMFADDGGELTIDKVSDSLFGGSSTAEGLVYTEPSAGTLRIDRYVVDGDFDSPDKITIDGMTFSTEGGEASALSAAKLTIEKPDRAVIDPSLVADGDLDFSAESMLFDKLTLVVNEQTVGSDTDFREMLEDFVGQMKLNSLEFRQVTQDGFDGLTLEGLSAEFDKLQQLGAGKASLEKLMMNGISVPDIESASAFSMDDMEEVPSISDMTLKALDIDTEGLVASLESMTSDQDWGDGQTGTSINNLVVDLGRIIELMPADERTNARMVSNVLTGGGNVLTLNAEGSGSLEELPDGKADYQVEGKIKLADALSLDSMVGLMLLTPEGMETADYVMQIEQGNFDLLDFESGKAHLELVNQGLFNRIPAVAATVQGISESEFLEQARTQAKGMGNMVGPQVSEVLLGLVNLMDGKANQMKVSVTLPSMQELEANAEDPLGLPDKLSMKVETE